MCDHLQVNTSTRSGDTTPPSLKWTACYNNSAIICITVPLSIPTSHLGTVVIVPVQFRYCLVSKARDRTRGTGETDNAMKHVIMKCSHSILLFALIVAVSWSHSIQCGPSKSHSYLGVHNIRSIIYTTEGVQQCVIVIA